MQPTPVLRVHDLTTCFDGDETTVVAVDKLSFDLLPGETLGLVGESGCGKSVTSLSIMRLLRAPGRVAGGSIEFDERDLLALPEKSMRAIRGNQISMIFQEPMTSLNPVITVGKQISESLMLHQGLSRRDALAQAEKLLELVQISDPARRVREYPYQLSGGMRQRAMIALALSCNPKVLLADEPTTALDATVQIQILLLLRELQRELGLSIVFVTHDIGAAAEIADRVAVMYGGRIVEQGTVADLLRAPRHPYTLALLKGRAHGAMRKGQRLETIPGSPPDLAALPPGCSFAPRCGLAQPRCQAAVPDIEPVAPGHQVRCIRVAETQ